MYIKVHKMFMKWSNKLLILTLRLTAVHGTKIGKEDQVKTGV